MKTRRSVAMILILALATGIAFVGGLKTRGQVATAADEQEEARAELEATLDFAARLERVFENAAAVAGPSVVSIRSEKTVRRSTPQFRHPFEDFFDSPFDDMFPRDMLPQREREFKRRGLGSGTILDAEGHVLTNNHVVGGADELKVELADGRTFEATVIGTDEATDLAVIKLLGDVKDLPVATLGRSDDLRIGQWVLALGNPFGLSHTVSAGIVSAKGRSGIGMTTYENWIQTDAAINPGNSGGPLVNLRGEVVGINVAIVSRTGGSVGIGFAIPIDMARSILDDLKHGRKVVRGYLGVIIEDLTQDRAEMFDRETTDGVFVREVVEGGPADKAGVQAGDIIIEYDGRAVKDMQELRHRVAATEPGKQAEMVVWRDGKEVKLTVTVAKLDQADLAGGAPDWLGITVQTLTEDMARNMGRPGLKGVLVAEVAPDSLASGTVRPGDVVLSVNRQKVADAAGYNRMIGSINPERGALLRIMDGRTGRTRFVLLRRR